ncbi:MAG: phospholipase D-like domain-containing protein [Gemmataceae bacterium]
MLRRDDERLIWGPDPHAVDALALILDVLAPVRVDPFLQEGLTPLVDSEHAIAHNKVMIIDSRTIVTGRFNFTNQAEHENAENLIVLKHYAELSAAYRQNFHAHKAHARAPELKAPRPSRFPERRAA